MPCRLRGAELIVRIVVRQIIKNHKRLNNTTPKSARSLQPKNVAVVGLTLSLPTWLVAFLSVGGEWFLMWQSKAWTDQDAALRMFTVVGNVLLFVALPDSEAQP
jgi:predicted small integral membrane protein